MKKILITAGPTKEKIDPVRFISNNSSGKMGYAIAEVAKAKGFDVTLISGPTNLQKPSVEIIDIESAAEMANAVYANAESADIIIMAAAVADYTPKKKFENKMKKVKGNLSLELERTEDILATLGKNKKDEQILIGFAAETENLLNNAEQKLNKKNLDWIIANDISKKGQGFQSDKNEITMISKDGKKTNFPLDTKLEIAEKILKTIGV